jgi:ankyrin repeat protein
MCDTTIRDNNHAAAIAYFNSDPANSDNQICMFCYNVLPAEPGSPSRVIASPCGHSFCDICVNSKHLRDRNIRSFFSKCFTTRTPNNYLAANQKTIVEILKDRDNGRDLFVSKSVLAIADCKLDVLKHIISCDSDELDIDCEHRNIRRSFFNQDKVLIEEDSSSSRDLLSIAEYHAKKETDATKKQEREQIVDFLTKSLIECYNSNNSVTKMVKVLDKILAKNNKELISFFLETIKDNPFLQKTEAKIEILTKVAQHNDLIVQEQFFEVLNIDLNNKDIATALLPLYYHQEHWSIVNKLISTTTDINCLHDFPVRSMVKSRNLECIDLLVNAGYNHDAKDKNGMTVMHYLLNLDEEDKEIAIDTKTLSFFIDRGFNINKTYIANDTSKEKPFFIPLAIKSIITKDENLFRLILDAMFKNDTEGSFIKGSWFSHIVFTTLKHGNYDFFYILTKHKISQSNLFFNNTFSTKDESYTVLSYIAKLGNAELTKYVIAYSETTQFQHTLQASSINHLNTFSGKAKEALFVASLYGHTEVMKILIDNGAHKNLESRYNYSDEAPIHVAAKSFHTDAVMLLLKTPGVNIHLKTNEKKTAYDYFLTHFNYYDNKGNFDIEATKEHHSIKDLYCLLVFAIKMGDNHIASILLKDKDIMSYNGEYKYLILNDFALKCHSDTVMSILAEPGVNIHLETHEGKIDYDCFVANFRYYDNEGNFDTEVAKVHHSIKDLYCLLVFAVAMGHNHLASILLKDKDIMSYSGEYKYLLLNFFIMKNNEYLIEDFISSLIENNIKIDVEFTNLKREQKCLFVELFKYVMKFNKIKVAKLIVDKIKEENLELLSSAVFEDNSTILEFIAKNHGNNPETRNILCYIITSIPFSVTESDSFKERLKQSQIDSSETEKNFLLSFCLEVISLQKIKRKKAQKIQLANN